MSTSPSILVAESLTRQYTQAGHSPLTVLADVSFTLGAGSTAAIVGPSGSGKTTLLGLAAGLDRPTSGTVTLCGHVLSALDEEARAAVRSRHVGFVFQNFQLLPTLTALENVLVPAELQGRSGAEQDARRLLGEVGLGDRLGHYPVQLSGGEQQRVALARAFVNKPAILFADEPTGNLDGATAELVERLLFDLNRSAGTTLVIVTHNPELAQRCGRVIRLRSGRVVADEAAAAR